MLIYILIIILLISFSFLEILLDGDKNPKIRFLNFFLCFLPILLIVIFRSTGFDFNAYYSAFETLHASGIKDLTGDIQFEPGFIFLNVISPSFLFLIVLIGSFSLILKYVLINKLSPYPIVSLLILFFSYVLIFEMGQIRQALAMGILLYALLFYKEKKKILLLIVIAALFHYSSLIFLLALIIPHDFKKWYYYVSLLLVANLLFIVVEPLLHFAAGLLPGFSGSKLLLYYEMEKGEGSISIPLLTSRLLLLAVYYWLRVKNDSFQDKPLYDYIFNLYFFSVFIYLGFSFFPQISGRGGAYFAIFEILLIPIVLKGFELIYARVLFFVFFISIFLLTFIMFLIKWGESFIPYTTWLFEF